MTREQRGGTAADTGGWSSSLLSPTVCNLSVKRVEVSPEKGETEQ